MRISLQRTEGQPLWFIKWIVVTNLKCSGASHHHLALTFVWYTKSIFYQFWNRRLWCLSFKKVQLNVKLQTKSHKWNIDFSVHTTHCKNSILGNWLTLVRGINKNNYSRTYLLSLTFATPPIQTMCKQADFSLSKSWRNKSADQLNNYFVHVHVSIMPIDLIKSGKFAK